MKANQKWSDRLGAVCVFSIFAGGAEGLDGGPTYWTLICLAVAAIAGWFSSKLAEGAK